MKLSRKKELEVMCYLDDLFFDSKSETQEEVYEFQDYLMELVSNAAEDYIEDEKIEEDRNKIK